jgi:hypothetical protein
MLDLLAGLNRDAILDMIVENYSQEEIEETLAPLLGLADEIEDHRSEKDMPTFVCRMNLYAPDFEGDSSHDSELYSAGDELFTSGKVYTQDFGNALPNNLTLISNNGSSIVVDGWLKWGRAFDSVEK